MKDLLGGKGANLAEMARLGLPVPPGFTISTEVCTYYYANRRSYPPALRAQVAAALARIEKALGRRFGDPDDPLLVSVRSGARASMPGMMDTILNLGLNDRTVQGLIRAAGNPRLAYDSYRRFVQLSADSGTGVAFTRDPATGENVFYGEFLMNAQGEDVVAGTRTPLPIAALEKENRSAYAELVRIRRTLERHYRDMMDIEFTIQQRKLYMLQCRVGKRTAFAAIRIAVDMVRERLISRDEALRRVEPEQLSQLLRPILGARASGRAAGRGQGGVAFGAGRM